MLDGWLEFHRVTLLLKCGGPPDEERKRRVVPTSNLLLHGHVHHLAEVENNWFVRVLVHAPDTGYPFATKGVRPRALICDPELANLARSGRDEHIRVCIGCNQACIGHFHIGYPISCIQHPETGRELIFPRRTNRRAAPSTRRRGRSGRFEGAVRRG